MPRISRLEWLVALAIFVTVPRAASAEARLAIDARGDCPSSVQVRQQVSAIAPELSEPPEEESDATTLTVEDLGDAYRVAVLDTRREFVDPARNCLERARVVSVVAALALDPLDVPESSEVEPRRPPPRSEAAVSMAFWLGGEVAAAPDATLAGGPVLHLQGGWEMLVVDAITGFRSGMQTEFERGRVVVYSVPLSLSVLVRNRDDAVQVAVGPGVAVDVISVHGRGFPSPETQTRAAVGGKLSTHVSVALASRLGAFTQLWAAYFPRPYELEVSGRGVVGETAVVLFGLGAGLTYDLH